MSKPVPPSFNLAQATEEALALHRQGQLGRAEKAYQRILKLRRNHFDALHLLGMLKHQTGKTGEAFRLVSAALEANPRSPDALSNLGLILHALKRDADALASFEKALAIDPDHAEALNNRGSALLALKRPAEALASYERLLAKNPQHVEPQVNRANALMELGRVQEAIAGYEALLARQPRHAGAWFNHGTALASVDRFEEALASYERALALTPDYPKALNNRGIALRSLNRHPEAVASYARAIAIDKDFAEAHLNHAHALLTLGALPRGFAEYEWRWKTPVNAPHARRFPQPLWLGDRPVGGKTILLHPEQGFGDTIHFVRYAKVLARAGARVVVQVPPALKDLLAGLEGAATVIADTDKLPPFDLHCPLGSLPLACKTEVGSIPADIPYVTAPPDRISKWRERLAGVPSPRVALSWSGNLAHANDRHRSIALARLAPLFANRNVRFISVQRELREADANALAGFAQLTHLGSDLADFADTAAVLALCDVVIAVDTAVAHLAGAMGRRLFVLLPFSPDWRWMLGRDDSPWYPTARLFRQPAIGDWDSVVARVATALSGLPSGKI